MTNDHIKIQELKIKILKKFKDQNDSDGLILYFKCLNIFLIFIIYDCFVFHLWKKNLILQMFILFLFLSDLDSVSKTKKNII